MKKSERTYENPEFDKEDVDEEKASTMVKDDPESINATTLSDEERLKELRSIRWNIACIAIGCVLVMAAMGGLMNSTTSLLESEGLGSTSLAVTSVTQFLGSAFLLNYIMKVWGVRKMVSLSQTLPIAFIASFAYPSWYTTLPASILLGLGSAFLTCSLIYGNSVGYYYATLTSGNSDTVLVAISGFLASAFGGGFLIGNTVIFAVLNIGLVDDVNDERNSTLNASVSADVCGANYCNEELSIATLKKPETFRYYVLVGVFFAMAVIGAILSLFVRDFSKELGITLKKKSEYFTIMKNTLGLLTCPRGYLLIAVTVFLGLEEAFITSVFTHAYISCAIGIPKVGMILMAYGGTQVAIMLSQAILVRILGRFFLILLGVSGVLACLVTVSFWYPNSDQLEVFFIIAVVWAASDAAILPTIFALYGILFQDNVEGSMSLATFWWAAGYMIAFIWSQFLCVWLKLYITIGVGCVGLFFYIILEVIIRRKNNTTLKETL